MDLLEKVHHFFVLLFWYVGERNWTVQSTSTIIKPRKEADEYKPGDIVVAKFKGKPYRAIVVRVKGRLSFFMLPEGRVCSRCFVCPSVQSHFSVSPGPTWIKLMYEILKKLRRPIFEVDLPFLETPLISEFSYMT